MPNLNDGTYKPEWCRERKRIDAFEMKISLQEKSNSLSLSLPPSQVLFHAGKGAQLQLISEGHDVVGKEILFCNTDHANKTTKRVFT